MSVPWEFQRCFNSNTQWSDRHLSSPDVPEAMIFYGCFGTGWLIRYSLLLWPPVEVTSRALADYICLFIFSQIHISYSSEQSYMHNRESYHGNADPGKNINLFLVIISQIHCKINSNTEANIIVSLSIKCRIFSSSLLAKLLKSYPTYLIVSNFLVFLILSGVVAKMNHKGYLQSIRLLYVWGFTFLHARWKQML